ncbi:MAG TPA: hypothetical protein VG942_01155 [Hyphomonadaceae bacterium]|nr:hypothetical protein [Hyphomonadaceae bacterium]
MAKKPTARVEYAFFDVTYEDGTQKSNRRVPAEVLDDPYDKEKAIRDAIEEQDRAISEKSGMPPLAIKTIKRSK